MGISGGLAADFSIGTPGADLAVRTQMGHPIMARNGTRKPITASFAAVATALILVSVWVGGILESPKAAMAADPPKPAKKDSRAFIKSKNATFTTSVEPAEARPGDAITFKVTAKLSPGFHIYKFSKGPGGPGPANTTFDFFDPAGLEIVGDWAASKEPLKHKDPNFPDLGALEYYENEVAWTIKLRIPPGAEPGKRIFRCQAGYMVCDDKTCSFPGQWTLPEAVLTVVVPAAGAASAAPADHEPAAPAVKQAANPASAPRQGADPNGEDFRRIALNGTATAADPPKPAKKDSSLFIKPKTAILTTSVEPAEASSGQTVTFKVTAKLNPGYHIYKTSKEQGPGPANTTFDFFDTASLKVEGDWVASKEPEKHKDPNFSEVDFVEYHEDEITWSIKLKIPPGTEPGKKSLRCQADTWFATPSHCSMLGPVDASGSRADGPAPAAQGVAAARPWRQPANQPPPSARVTDPAASPAAAGSPAAAAPISLTAAAKIQSEIAREGPGQA